MHRHSVSHVCINYSTVPGSHYPYVQHLYGHIDTDTCSILQGWLDFGIGDGSLDYIFEHLLKAPLPLLLLHYHIVGGDFPFVHFGCVDDDGSTVVPLRTTDEQRVGVPLLQGDIERLINTKRCVVYVSECMNICVCMHGTKYIHNAIT